MKTLQKFPIHFILIYLLLKFKSLRFGRCFIFTGNDNLDDSVFCFLMQQYIQLCTISIWQEFKPVAFYSVADWFSTYVEQGRGKDLSF